MVVGSEAFNYNENATVADDSCIEKVFGCTNSNYVEFDSLANTNDGSCENAYSIDVWTYFPLILIQWQRLMMALYSYGFWM